MKLQWQVTDRTTLLNEFEFSPAMMNSGAKAYLSMKGLGLDFDGASGKAADFIFTAMVLAAKDTDICHLLKVLDSPEIAEERPSNSSINY